VAHIQQVRLVLLLPTLTAVDQPWGIAIPSIWISVEANLAIICCSLPALRLFVRHFAPKLIGEYSFGRSRHEYSNSAGASNMIGSKMGDKYRSRSTYGKMDHSDLSGELELQPQSQAAWSECRRSSQEGFAKSKTGVQSASTHLDDPTPPGTAYEYDPRGIMVTKTFG
jgi:hypothetical protein